MSNYIDTSILSISSKKISDCNDVVNTLHKLGVICSVVDNNSVIKKNNELIIEHGCNITLTNTNISNIKKDIWVPLKNKYNLGCAHLLIHGKYRGCIYDFLDKSKCPPK